MLTQPIDWLGAPSWAMAGIEATLEDAIDRAKARYPARNFCVVQEWVWIEFKAPQPMVEGLALNGETPNVLIAATILHDSQERFGSGRGVRTFFLIDYEGPGFFVTRKTVYVLLGAGRRIQLPFKSEFLYG